MGEWVNEWASECVFCLKSLHKPGIALVTLMGKWQLSLGIFFSLRETLKVYFQLYGVFESLPNLYELLNAGEFL